MRCKQDMIDAGEKLVPRTCPVHGIQRCRPTDQSLIDWAPQMLHDRPLNVGAVVTNTRKKIYLAGPMRGYRYFNKPVFDTATAMLRSLGHEVFSPVESTEQIYGPNIYTDNPEGDEPKAGICSRTVFGADLAYICAHATAVALLPGWRSSKGATAEHAAAVALGLEIIEL